MKITAEYLKKLVNKGTITHTGIVKNVDGELALTEKFEKMGADEFISKYVTQVGVAKEIKAETDENQEDQKEETESPKSEVSIVNNIVGELVVGGTVESTVSIKCSEDLVGTMVRVKGTVKPSTALAVKYQEGSEWKELPFEGEEFYFGASAGFPLNPEATSSFKSEIKEAGNISFVLEVIEVATGKTLATSNETVTIPEPEVEEVAVVNAAPLNAVGLGNPVAPAPAEETKKRRKTKKTEEISVDPITE